jgi:ParB family chromosome partitioning protein
VVDVKREFEEVPVDLLSEPERRVRNLVSEEGMDELRRSISENGVLVPLIVEREGERFRVIAGLRRLLCSRALGLATVPCIVVEAGDEWREWATLTENRVREAVNAYDEALYVAEIVSRRGIDQLAVAKMLGVSEPWVSQRLGILRWPADVRAALTAGWLSFAVGRELAAIEGNAFRAECLRLAHRAGCSVRQAAEWRRGWQREQEGASGVSADVQGEGATEGTAEEFPCVLCQGIVPQSEGAFFFICGPCQAELQAVRD